LTKAGRAKNRRMEFIILESSKTAGPDVGVE
jgi:hypothetical protein